jgi:2-polyprenyl-6-methoxyphenol hydroxylase-like FAD-dependent oxidoreductase
MSARTAAVAGAGIAGLAAAAILAQRGLEVEIYERTDSPREFGAGIYLKENSLPVLEEIGAFEEVADSGVSLRAVRIADERDRIIVTRDTSRERVIVVERSVLHGALLNAALRAGAKLITGTAVAGARPDGTLLLAHHRPPLADGERVAGARPDGTLLLGGSGPGSADDSIRVDVVVAADGVNSRIRDSLGLTRVNRTLPSGATRLLIPREETDNVSTEYWAGSRRVGIAPCSADTSYVFMIGPEKDRRATRVPVDREYWTAALPHLVGVFERISDDSGIHHAHAYVSCKAWTSGRVAVIGDAAHAQPPNLGQGAGLAIANARKLADFVAGGGDVPEMLRAWERHVRRGSLVVQRLTTAYDMAGSLDSLLPARSRVFHQLSTFGPTARQWEYWWRGGIRAPHQQTPTAVAADGPVRG